MNISIYIRGDCMILSVFEKKYRTKPHILTVGMPTTPFVDSTFFHTFCLSVMEKEKVNHTVLVCKITKKKTTTEIICFWENQHIQQIRRADDCTYSKLGC